MTRGRKPLPQEIKRLRGTDQPCRERPSSVIGEPVRLEEIGSKCQVSGLKSSTPRARDIYWATCRKVAAQGMLDPTFCSQILFYAIEYDIVLRCEEGVLIPRLDTEVVAEEAERIMRQGLSEVQQDIAEADNSAFSMHLKSRLESNIGTLPENIAARLPALVADISDGQQIYQKKIYIVVSEEQEDDQQIYLRTRFVIGTSYDYAEKRFMNKISKYIWGDALESPWQESIDQWWEAFDPGLYGIEKSEY